MDAKIKKVWILVYWHPSSGDSGGEILGVWAYTSKKAAQKYSSKLMLHHIEVVHNDGATPLSTVEAATNYLKAGDFEALKNLHESVGTGYQLDIYHKDIKN